LFEIFDYVAIEKLASTTITIDEKVNGIK